MNNNLLFLLDYVLLCSSRLIVLVGARVKTVSSIAAAGVKKKKKESGRFSFKRVALVTKIRDPFIKHLVFNGD